MMNFFFLCFVGWSFICCLFYDYLFTFYGRNAFIKAIHQLIKHINLIRNAWSNCNVIQRVNLWAFKIMALASFFFLMFLFTLLEFIVLSFVDYCCWLIEILLCYCWWFVQEIINCNSNSQDISQTIFNS